MSFHFWRGTNWYFNLIRWDNLNIDKGKEEYCICSGWMQLQIQFCWLTQLLPKIWRKTSPFYKYSRLHSISYWVQMFKFIQVQCKSAFLSLLSSPWFKMLGLSLFSLSTHNGKISLYWSQWNIQIFFQHKKEIKEEVKSLCSEARGETTGYLGITQEIMNILPEFPVRKTMLNMV